MSNAEQILTVSVEARINRLEKEMRKASGVVGKNFDQIEKRSKRAADRMESEWSNMAGKFAGIGKTMAAGIVGGLVAGGIAGITQQIADVARGIAEVGDAAVMAGIDIEAFSTLRYVAEQNRIGVDVLADGLKELNLRADEFIVTSGGSAAEAFQRLGFGADELAEKLRQPDELFVEIIGRLGDLDRAAQIRIADEIFGGQAGERFVQLIDQGEAGLRDTMQAARDLGLVIDSDLVTKAGDLDNAFRAVATTVGSTLQAAIVNASWALYDFMQQFQAVENRTTASLENSLTELGAERVRLEAETANARNVIEQQAIIDPLVGEGRDQSTLIDAFDSRMREIADEEAAILNVLNSRTPVEPPRPSITVAAPESAASTATSGGSGGGGGRSAASTREQADATAELIEELRNELAMLGQSELEQRVNAELRRAGAGATDGQKTSIRDLVLAIETERGAMDRLADAADNAKGIAKDFMSGLLTDLRNGVDGATALANAFGRLGDKLLDMALDSVLEGLFQNLTGAVGGGLFGGLFGFADGGMVKAATGGLIRGPGTGTSDSIPAKLSDGEFVVRASQTARHLDLLKAINAGGFAGFATGGLVGSEPRFAAANDNRAGNNTPAMTINAPVTVNGSAGTPEQNDDLARKMAREMEGTMRGVVADEMRRATRPGNMLRTKSR